MGHLLVDVATVNPRLAGAAKTLVDELQNGELPEPEMLEVFGQHIREIGELIIGRAHYMRPVALRSYHYVDGDDVGPP